MSPWSHFPFARFTFVLMGGLLAARYGEGSIYLAGILLAFLLFFYVLVVVGTPRNVFHVRRPWLGLLGLMGLFLIGYLRGLTHAVHHDPKHLIHCTTSIGAYEAIALEDAHEKFAHSSVAVAIRRGRVKGRWHQVQGKVQILWSKHTAFPVRYGDILLIKGQPKEVRAVSNPYAFDYAHFLGLSQIHHQQYVAGEDIVVIAHRSPNPVKALSFRVLRYCQSVFNQFLRHEEVRAVVLALVLGQKDDLTPEVSATYVHTGTMHVLAVSGLHVGIVYWVLCILLAPLRHIGHLRSLFSVIVLISIWFYAFVTGLSPSVLRASTMFTLAAMAPVLNRQTSSYNALSASAFLLLFWDPSLLFAVGFQLSYLAVLGILYLQPRIYKLLKPSNRALDKLWLFSSVSLGAQIATAPLSIYYFHQFPTYFLIANWVVVPAALAILCLGLLVLVTSVWTSLSLSMAWLLETVVLRMHVFLERIQKLPYSLVEPIYVSVWVVFLLYGILILFLAFLHHKRMSYLIASSVLTILLSLYTTHVSLSRYKQCRVIFYSIDRHQVVAFVKGRHSTLCVDRHFKVNAPKYAHHVQPSQMALGITSSDTYLMKEAVRRDALPMHCWHGIKVVVWQGKTLIIVDRENKNLPALNQKLHIDFLVVEANAVTRLKPLLDRFDVGTLIIGASNGTMLAQKLQKEAVEHGLYSHSLQQQGAFMVSW